jgi:Zn-dependent protease with chaperone function
VTDVSHHGGVSTSPSTRAKPALPDWGAGRIGAPKVVPALAGAVAAIVVVAVLVALTVPIAGVIAGVVLLAGLGVWVATRGRAILRDAGARPLEREEAPRFANIADGLAADIGIEPPGLWISDQGGANSFVVWAGGPQVGVTRELLDGFARTEVEAVVAHALARIAGGEARATTIGAALGPLATTRRYVGGALDVAVAALTRYPPALATAIGRATPRTGRFAAAWFAAEAPSHVPAAERIAAVEDL